MSDPLHRAIWRLRVKRGIHISKKAERYIVNELEDDLFPYGFGDGSDDDIISEILAFLKRVDNGEDDINSPKIERVLDRYELLKEEFYCLLAEKNRAFLCSYDEDWNDDIPF
jgi:hypothetical protein